MPRACSSRKRAQAPQQRNSPFSSGWFMYHERRCKQAASDYLEGAAPQRHGHADDASRLRDRTDPQSIDQELGAADIDLTIVPGTTDYACFPEYPELEHSAAIDYAAFTAEDTSGTTSPFMNEGGGRLGLPSR